MTLELNFAKNILSSIINCPLTGVTSSFMNNFHPVRGKLQEYRNIIKEPICLNEMNDKLINAEYQSIKEFVCDFRLMLFNSYRYFGCDSKMGKFAAKLEGVFEQKLLLLPIDIRVKTSMDAVLADDVSSETFDTGLTRRRGGDRSYNTDIRMATPIKAMMEEMEKCGSISSLFADNDEFQNDPMNYLIIRLNKWQEKRRTNRLVKKFDNWFSTNVLEQDRKVLDTCSEFVEFLQFINFGYIAIGLDQLLSESIKVNHITIEDLQFAILFPRTSSILAAIVSLITTKSKNRSSIAKGPLPNYNQWNKNLAAQVSFLYKSWIERGLCDKPYLFVQKYSIEPKFFKILGHRRAPTDTKMFHELSVYQRCHLLLSLCYMTLRGQESVHNSIDRTIEWDDHQKILLSRVGEFEYVRFSGIGEYSSFFVYRIRAVDIEEELANYSAQDVPVTVKRKLKEKPLNKFRMPTWYANEVRRAKSKKSVAVSKKKVSIVKAVSTVKTERSTRSRRSTFVEEVIDDVVKEVREDVFENIEVPICKTENIDQSEPGSDSSNDQDDEGIENNEDIKGDFKDEVKEEEDIPEICEPLDGELELVAKDLNGITNLMNYVMEKMTMCEGVDYEDWKTLHNSLEVVKIFFMENESIMIDKLRDGRLRLLQEVGHSEEPNILIEEESVKSEEIYPEVKSKNNVRKSERPKSKRQWCELSSESEVCNSDDYEDEDDSYQSNERYSVKEIKQSIRKSERQRTKRQWRELSSECDDDEESVKLPKINNKDSPPLLTPSLASSLDPPSGNKTESTDSQKKVKRKVFQIYNDFFTDELIPVRVKDDGSLESLPLESVTEERYALARKMIDLYKVKLNNNGHNVHAKVEASDGTLIK